ncbi:MAG TPA: hypothetical protein VI337_04110 [Nitrospirales bacterium]|nr:hypothetical protein [Nitrospirales bacterium]
MNTADVSEIVTCPNAECAQPLRIPAGEFLQVTCPTCQTSFTRRPDKMAGAQSPTQALSAEFQRKAWALGELILAIAHESVLLAKRQAPSAANLPRKQEWETFLEFLKVLFNLADRVATFHVPINEYLQFLDALEDAVIDQMNNAFRKQQGPGYDGVPVKVSIAAAFDIAQKTYQPYRFLVTEEGAEKGRYFAAFSEAVAAVMGLKGNKAIMTAASMCARSSIGAFKGLMESVEGHPPAPSGHA